MTKFNLIIWGLLAALFIIDIALTIYSASLCADHICRG